MKLRRWFDNLRSFWLGEWPSRDPALSRLFGPGPTSTGVAVTEWTALNYSAVWAAVSLISQSVSTLPFILYERLPTGGKRRAPNHPLYRVLHDLPNPEMTSVTFRETLQAHLLTWGNAYAEIERDNGGRVKALWPMTPDRVTPFRADGSHPGDTAGEALRIRYKTDNFSKDPLFFEADDVLHVPGLGFDGLVGYSVIRMARESIGLGLATERFGGTFFGGGTTFGGVLSHPKLLSQRAKDSLRESIEAQHRGVERAHKFLILQEGMQYHKLGVDPEHAQFLETRKFQTAEIARWFNIPPHKLKDLERATFSNIEHQSIEYVTETLRPWLVRWEQEIHRKLLTPQEQTRFFAEHLVEGLLRGDLKSRYDAYAIGRQWGWLSVDEIRERENLNPLPDGQGHVYLVNGRPADQVDGDDDEPAPLPQPARSETTINIAGIDQLAAELKRARREADDRREERDQTLQENADLHRRNRELRQEREKARQRSDVDVQVAERLSPQMRRLILKQRLVQEDIAADERRRGRP